MVNKQSLNLKENLPDILCKLFPDSVVEETKLSRTNYAIKVEKEDDLELLCEKLITSVIHESIENNLCKRDSPLPTDKKIMKFMSFRRISPDRQSLMELHNECTIYRAVESRPVWRVYYPEVYIEEEEGDLIINISLYLDLSRCYKVETPEEV